MATPRARHNYHSSQPKRGPMRVSLTLRSAGLPVVVGAVVFTVIAINYSRVLADGDASAKLTGSKTGSSSISHGLSELDYYDDGTGIDWEQTPEFAAEDSPQGCDSIGLGCSGCGLSYAPGRPQKPHREMPGDINRGDCPPYRYTIPDCQRAGNPHCVALWAKPSISTKYSTGFVGGGAALGGRSRYCSEGVWGLDYHGLFPYRRVWMRWTSGREQGGEGAYKTDGHTGPFAKH